MTKQIIRRNVLKSQEQQVIIQSGRNGYVDQSQPNEVDLSLPGWLYLEYSEAGSRMAAIIQLVK